MNVPRSRTQNATSSWYHARLVRAALAILRVRTVLCLAVALGTGCARPAQGPLPGASDNWASAPESRPPPAAPAPAWDAYAEIRQWPSLNPAPFTSRGHQPEQQVDVRVSPDSRAAYLALVADTVFPNGTVLAELPHAAGGSGYGMRKANGAWNFVELDGNGGVRSSGALALCAGCHAHAASDCVFGLPQAP